MKLLPAVVTSLNVTMLMRGDFQIEVNCVCNDRDIIRSLQSSFGRGSTPMIYLPVADNEVEQLPPAVRNVLVDLDV
jgi:hypothetical protein